MIAIEALFCKCREMSPLYFISNFTEIVSERFEDNRKFQASFSMRYFPKF